MMESNLFPRFQMFSGKSGKLTEHLPMLYAGLLLRNNLLGLADLLDRHDAMHPVTYIRRSERSPWERRRRSCTFILQFRRAFFRRAPWRSPRAAWHLACRCRVGP